MDSSDALLTIQMKLQGFFQREQQLDLIQPYFDKFFEIVHDVVEKKDREFHQTFCMNLSPAFLATPEVEEKFKAL